jgi:hypothetical protein
MRRGKKTLRLAHGAGSDSGLDDISNIDSALSGSGNGSGARLSTSLNTSLSISSGAAVVVGAGNEGAASRNSTTSRQGTAGGQNNRSSGHGSSGSVGGRSADGGLQAGRDAGNLEVVLVLAEHVEVVAGSLVSGGAGQAGVEGSGARVATRSVLTVTFSESVVTSLASLSSASTVKGLVVNEAGSEVSETSVVNALALRRGGRVGTAAAARVEQLRASVLAVSVQLLALVVGDQ